MTTSYSATADNSLGKKREDNRSGRNSPDNATKRVRAKRSKPNVSGAVTPLLGSAYSAVDFQYSLVTHGSMPLPLMWVLVFISSDVELMNYLFSIAHHLSKAIFKFRREGLLETVGPAGMPFRQVGSINTKTFLFHRCQCTNRHVRIIITLPFSLSPSLVFIQCIFDGGSIDHMRTYSEYTHPQVMCVCFCIVITYCG